MIFVIVEDGTVEVVEDLAQAHTYEPFDVENQVFVFYDEDGAWLRPTFTTPNRRDLFGLVVTHGAFELARSAVLDPGIDPFDVAIGEAAALEPNRHFASLDAIRSHIASKKSHE
jgi:hypothetical protein